MFLIRLWDKYDRELIVDLHKKVSPPQPTLKQELRALTFEVIKTLLTGSGIFRKKEKKR